MAVLFLSESAPKHFGLWARVERVVPPATSQPLASHNSWWQKGQYGRAVQYDQAPPLMCQSKIRSGSFTYRARLFTAFGFTIWRSQAGTKAFGALSGRQEVR